MNRRVVSFTEQKAAKEAKKKKEKEDAEKEVERQQKQVERLHNLISDRDPRVSIAGTNSVFFVFGFNILFSKLIFQYLLEIFQSKSK